MKGKTWSGCVISSSLALRASSWWARDAETCLFCSVCVHVYSMCGETVWDGGRQREQLDVSISFAAVCL